jgi:hypothetical protein
VGGRWCAWTNTTRLSKVGRFSSCLADGLLAGRDSPYSRIRLRPACRRLRASVSSGMIAGSRAQLDILSLTASSYQRAAARRADEDLTTQFQADCIMPSPALSKLVMINDLVPCADDPRSQRTISTSPPSLQMEEHACRLLERFRFRSNHMQNLRYHVSAPDTTMERRFRCVRNHERLVPPV